jgi:hypothetical protein
MAIVTEISWDDMLEGKPLPETPAHQAWREAVAEIADKAHEKLPACNGRIDKAVALVLAGDVQLLPDGTAQVASQSNGTTMYHIANSHCDCRDFERAPGQLCKHRLALGLARRAQELVRAKLHAASNGQAAAAPAPAPAPAEPEAQSPAPTAPLPEAPVSITLKATLHGHDVMVTLRGVDFASVKAASRASVRVAQRPGSSTATNAAASAGYDATCTRRQAILSRTQRRAQAV